MINAYLDERFRYDEAIKKAGTHLESEASVNVKTDQLGTPLQEVISSSPC